MDNRPIRRNPAARGIDIWTSDNIANLLNGLALAFLAQPDGEYRRGAVDMLRAICAAAGLEITEPPERER